MDSEYLKKHVGDALTRGLVEISQIRPNDPIEYLGYWLRKYVENREHDAKKQQELAKLEQEKEEYAVEQKRLKAMEEEQQLIAQQEAYEKAAAEPVVVDNTPRPLPPEISESLPTLVERDEDEKKPEAVEAPTESASTETVPEIPVENSEGEQGQNDSLEQEES